jgi:hypothetical protein
MEIIGMGELRTFLTTHLPSYEDPVIFISSDFIPGCPKCNSSATVYYIKLAERGSILDEQNVIKAEKHKFPIDIYVKYPVMKGAPQKIVIGTKESKDGLKMILRRVID